MEQNPELVQTENLIEEQKWTDGVITMVLTADNHLGYSASSQPPRKRELRKQQLRHAFNRQRILLSVRVLISSYRLVIFLILQILMSKIVALSPSDLPNCAMQAFGLLLLAVFMILRLRHPQGWIEQKPISPPLSLLLSSAMHA